MNKGNPPKSRKEVRERLLEKYSEKYPNLHMVPQIEKVVIHCSVGESGENLEKAEEILKDITGRKPAIIRAKETVQSFGIREGEPIGWKITLREKKAFSFLNRALEVYERTIWKESIDKYGNLSFGIEEHQELPGAEYDPELGIIGFDISVSLSKPGYRVKRRKKGSQSIPEKHRVTKEDAIRFFKTMGTIREGKRQKQLV